MKFVFFHLMPWDEFPHEDQDWPVGNREFDPKRGTELYETYIDVMAFAEECGRSAESAKNGRTQGNEGFGAILRCGKRMWLTPISWGANSWPLTFRGAGVAGMPS